MQKQQKRKKFFFCILSHKNSQKRNAQRIHLEKFGNENVIFYYFIGDPDQKEEYIVDEKDRVVYIKAKDNYESLPMKTYLSLKYAKTVYGEDVEGIFKTDDDIQIDLNKLYQGLCSNSDLDYFGNCVNVINPYVSSWHFGKCEDPEINQRHYTVPSCQYCSGGGYYINSRNIDHILLKESVFQNGIFEDVCTGLALNSENIFPDPSIIIKDLGCTWE
jgi:hypothetical protein